ncbi:FtsW/RodA/SpoVE family cell cycle protein [Mangrovibacterium lignilyticum]|uniref:FtsW/RodA/SpoVE family cell cycle protein n=1 Tax=Mangrovibacterium lignilyticum TaxID=2668052 RepID=UPI0013D75B0D|nr:FtsW/RodA/SpoVE family cell cycle protein [Mangrovibacterium lignilyticum]
MKLTLGNIIKGDRILWVVLFFLSLASILIVYSATGRLAYREAGGFTAHYLIRHTIFITAGFFIMAFLVNVVPVKFYSLIAPTALIFTIGLLILALIQYKLTGKATPRSLDLKFISFQPAELAKLSLVMFGAKMLASRQKSEKELRTAFFWVLGASVIVCGIISIGNISTAAVIFMGMMGLMFVGRIPFKFMGLTALAGILMALMMYFMAPYMPHSFGRLQTFKQRIDDHLFGDEDAEEGTTQADFAKLAIFEGGMIGKGPGGSDVSNYMEAGYNDFIYAIFVEEYGIVGGIAIVLLYLIFLFRGVAIVRASSRTFPAFLATGIVLIYTIQAFVNMSVSTGIVPVTGQPLPWISMGGTSMIFTAAGFGLILSVSYLNKKNSKAEQAEQPVVVTVPDEDQELK